MTVSLMPRDVSTQWNSTYDMLAYALKHRKAVDSITQGRELGLRKFELADHEWETVEQLHDVLKVSLLQRSFHTANNHKQLTVRSPDTQGRYAVFFTVHSKSRNGYSRDGPYRQATSDLFPQQEVHGSNSFVHHPGQKHSESLLFTH